jgi:hypothetical protein
MAQVIGEVQGENFSFFVFTLWSTPFNLQCESFYQRMSLYNENTLTQ